MTEIPMRYVHANQIGIVIFVVAAIAFQQPYVLLALFLVQAVGFVAGIRANLFVAIVRAVLRRSVVDKGQTQAAELTRFNNALALLFLAVSLVCFAIGWNIAGYVVAALLGCAALSALFGYCIGCTIYYQYKRLRAQRRIGS